MCILMVIKMYNWIFYFYVFSCMWYFLDTVHDFVSVTLPVSSNLFRFVQFLFLCLVVVILFWVVPLLSPYPRSVSRPKLRQPTMCSWNNLLKIPTHCECCVRCHSSGPGSGATRTSPLSLITLRNSTLILPSGQCIVRKI